MGDELNQHHTVSISIQFRDSDISFDVDRDFALELSPVLKEYFLSINDNTSYQLKYNNFTSNAIGIIKKVLNGDEFQINFFNYNILKQLFLDLQITKFNEEMNQIYAKINNLIDSNSGYLNKLLKLSDIIENINEDNFDDKIQQANEFVNKLEPLSICSLILTLISSNISKVELYINFLLKFKDQLIETFINILCKSCLTSHELFFVVIRLIDLGIIEKNQFILRCPDILDTLFSSLEIKKRKKVQLLFMYYLDGIHNRYIPLAPEQRRLLRKETSVYEIFENELMITLRDDDFDKFQNNFFEKKDFNFSNSIFLENKQSEDTSNNDHRTESFQNVDNYDMEIDDIVNMDEAGIGFNDDNDFNEENTNPFFAIHQNFGLFNIDFEIHPFVDANIILENNSYNTKYLQFVANQLRTPYRLSNKLHVLYERHSMLTKSSLCPIEVAAYYGSVNIFKLLLTKYISSNCELPKKLAKFAIAGGNFEIIQLCDENFCDFSKCLTTAICFNRYEICEWLIKDKNCRTFKFKFNFPSPKIFLLLLRSFLLPIKEFTFLFSKSVIFGNYPYYRLLNELSSIDKKVKFIKKNTRYAIYSSGSSKIFNYLLKKINDNDHLLNDNSVNLNSLLLYSLLGGNPKIIDNTLYIYYTKTNKMFNLTSPIKKKFSFPSTLFWNLNMKYIKNYVDMKTPFHLSAISNNSDVVMLILTSILLNCPPDETSLYINIKTFKNMSVLHISAMYNSISTFDFLFRAPYIDKRPRAFKNRLPLHIAAKYGSLDIIKYLAQNDEFFDINEGDGFGYTALHLASKYGNLRTVEYILSFSLCNVNAMNLNLATPLFLACLQSQYEVAKILFDKHNDDILINTKTKAGNYPLKVACRHQCHDIIQLLLSNPKTIVPSDFLYNLCSTKINGLNRPKILGIISTIISEGLVDVNQKFGPLKKTILQIAIEHRDEQLGLLLITSS